MQDVNKLVLLLLLLLLCRSWLVALTRCVPPLVAQFWHTLRHHFTKGVKGVAPVRRRLCEWLAYVAIPPMLAISTYYSELERTPALLENSLVREATQSNLSTHSIVSGAYK